MPPLELLLLPGLDGTGTLFRHFMPALPSTVDPRVVPYPHDRIVSYEALGEAVSLPERPFALLGESYGGPLAIRLAARRPRHLKALVLAATFATCPSSLGRRLKGWPLPNIFTLPSREVLMTFLLSDRKPPHGLLADLRAIRARVPPRVLMARLEEVVAVDVRRLLARVNVPVLYLAARRDRLVPPRVPHELHRFAPAMSIVRFDAPHLVLQHRPRECADAIAQFVSRASGA